MDENIPSIEKPKVPHCHRLRHIFRDSFVVTCDNNSTCFNKNCGFRNPHRVS